MCMHSFPGTHFRYGTISWLPRTCDPSSGGRSSLTDPTSSTNCVANQVYVEFSVFLAFRRDYAWGRFFGEEWSNQYDTSGNRIFQALDGTGGFQYFDVPAGQTSDYYMTQFEQEAWAIRFPSGYGSSPRQPIPASNVPGHEVAGAPHASLPDAHSTLSLSLSLSLFLCRRDFFLA